MATATRTKKDIEQLLRGVPLFAGCSSRELQSIAAVTKEVSFEPGAAICREGEPGIGMHIVAEGEVKVMVGGRTRRRLGPGAFFGEIALLDGGPRTASVVAETPTKTLAIAFWNYKSLLKRQPGLALKMLEEVCRRARTSDTSISD